MSEETKDSVLSLVPLDLTQEIYDEQSVNKFGKAAQLAGSIYATSDVDLNSTLSSLVAPNVQAYILSSGDDKKIDGNLKSIVLIDQNNKSVTVVTAGTRLGSTYSDMAADMSDDLGLSLGFQPSKKSSVQQLNNLILENLGNEKDEYNFQYVGHSLGAVVSDVAATHMATQLAKKDIRLEGKVSAVTFDNPGSYTLVHRMLNKYKDKLTTKEKELHKTKVLFRAGDKLEEEKKLHKDRKTEIDSIKLEDLVDYNSFNNRENFINTNDKQAGKLYTIVPHDQKERGAFFRMVGWLAEKMPGVIVKKILKVISYGSLSEQAKEHGTDNFISVLKEENGTILYNNSGTKIEMSILDFMHDTKPLEYNKDLFNAFPKIHDHTADVSPEFSMHASDGSRVEFSRDELIGFLTSPDVDKKISKDTLKDLARHLKMDKGYSHKPSAMHRAHSSGKSIS